MADEWTQLTPHSNVPEQVEWKMRVFYNDTVEPSEMRRVSYFSEKPSGELQPIAYAGTTRNFRVVCDIPLTESPLAPRPPVIPDIYLFMCAPPPPKAPYDVIWCATADGGADGSEDQVWRRSTDHWDLRRMPLASSHVQFLYRPFHMSDFVMK